MVFKNIAIRNVEFVLLNHTLVSPPLSFPVLAKIPVSSALSSSRILSHPLFSSLSSFLSPSGPSSLSTDDLLALAVHISRTTTLLDDNFTFAKYARFFPSTYKSR